MPKTSKTGPAPSLITPFPVIGIGASAGGLEAYKSFLQTIPKKSGMAYVLVQHLDPTHESLLPGILSGITTVPVKVITNNIPLAHDHIYVIPANKLVVAADGILKLHPRPPDGENRPIDIFFTSLGKAYKNHAIGILLSGSGVDGTAGLRSIKENGGITFSQDPASAGQNHMPQSAIDAGVVDFILSPENMMAQLLPLAAGQPASDSPGKTRPVAVYDDAIGQILLLLRIHRQVDFDYYKKNTICRRIARRMVIHGAGNTADYLVLLKNNAEELELLFNDMLIPVTEFLRDRKPFTELKKSVFPLLVKGKSIREPLRIWVAGCSTGEEAYSIAISLREFLGDDAARIKIQLYATDISQRAIAVARTGIYTAKQLDMFSAAQLQQYFINIDGHYQVAKFIRDFCVFAHHNFLSDPPFAKLDLISCRNVLIYIESFLQKKVFDMFHYALKENGFLLLGQSETTTGSAVLFAPFNPQEKIFVKKEGNNHFVHTVFSARERNGREGLKNRLRIESGKPGFKKAADDILLQEYTPAGVVINDVAEIVHFRGDTNAFLTPPDGKPTINLLKMARPGLSFELRTGLHKAITTGNIISKEGIRIQVNGTSRRVAIKVIPLPGTAEPYFLVLFQEKVPEAGSPAAPQAAGNKNKAGLTDPRDLHIHQQDLELVQVREDMRIITEEQEAFNEELQAANEELLSGSEELLSLNEELETSKEEVESSNEELLIVNQELMESNICINDAKNYSDSIIATIHEPFIILNKHLTVRQANRPFYKLFQTNREQTEGLRFFEMAGGQWDIPELRILLHHITDGKTNSSCVEVRHEFTGIGERVLIVNATIMRRESDYERLLLLAIQDITEQRQAERKMTLLNKALEGKMQHRTKELEKANKSLDGSNLKLQRSNEDLQRFAHVASHDLKEPIRKIKTFASLLEADMATALSENGRTYLSKLQSASDRMLNMVDGVLAYSVINGFEQPTEQIDLREIIRQIQTDLEVLVQEKGAVITFGDLPQMEGAAVLMYQLFYNLINNSLKFTKEGEKQIIVISSKLIRLGNKDFAEITLQDSGIGFDNIEAEKIFVTFTRLHPKDKYEGTGLGLSLCKKIVHRHGGTITASGSKNDGALFTITLPLKQAIGFI